MSQAFGSLTFENLTRALKSNGVERLYYKQLAPNDNSKNQVYLGGDLSVLNVLPSEELLQIATSSGKPGAVGKEILKAGLHMFWLDSDGTATAAPHAQLILYPQYPEVRLSGFLAGSAIKLGEWFDPNKKGRAGGRVFIVGVAKNGCLYGHLALPDSALAGHILSLRSIGTFGALTEVPLASDDGLLELRAELRRIHELGWIEGKRLDSARRICPCNNPNCGGYTLEAELGITPNGFAEPDFRGWEIKTIGVDNFSKVEAKIITLMTPEPDGGIYKEKGVETFIRRFGYPDTAGRGDRMNFGGVHLVGKVHPMTKMNLVLTGYELTSGKIKDVNGGIALMAGKECAALWTFRKLIDHWKRKHDKAAYVPNISRLGPPRSYQYGEDVLLGRGTDFDNLLRALASGIVYYDPGIKMENASTAKPSVKRRSQFRIKARGLAGLYRSFDKVSV